MSTPNILQLPKDVLFQILSHLDFQNLCSVVQVNKELYGVVRRYKKLLLRKRSKSIRIEKHWEKNVKISLFGLDGRDFQCVIFGSNAYGCRFPEYSNVTLFTNENWISTSEFYPNDAPMALDCENLEKTLEKVVDSILAYTTSDRVEMRYLSGSHEEIILDCLERANYSSTWISVNLS